MKPQILAHRFAPHDLVGGDLALDFVNTTTDWDVAPKDWVDSYPRLLAWAELAGGVTPGEAAALERQAAADPDAADGALARARETRLALYGVLRAATDREAPDPGDVALAEAAWRAAAGAMALQVADGAGRLEVSADRAGLDLVALRASAAAMALLTGERTARLRRCAGSRCGWLFVDVSKAGRRRWCDMATCGSDEKQRRHAARRKEAPGS